MLFAYNISMDLKGTKKRNIALWTLRIILTAACIAMLAFIFSNSLQTGEQSSAQSSTVVDTVQDVAGAINPESPIATATGAAKDRLHSAIRTLAHFSEFGALGALMGWCCLSYTRKWQFLFIPFGGVALVPLLDEYLQTFSAGRGAEWKDIAVDGLGGVLGLILAVELVWLGIYIYQATRVRKMQKIVSQTEPLKS